MERVLVVFQAMDAKTESLALAFGLGAVEGGANIRLRHLDSAAHASLAHQGYAPPKDADLEWAQVIGLALESPTPEPELIALVQQIRHLCSTGGAQRGKMAYVFSADPDMPSIAYALDALEQMCFERVFAVAPDIASANALGKEAALLQG